MPSSLSTSAPTLILGSGLAGFTVARELRKLIPEEAIMMVTRDHGDFYSKPSLSNALAQGKTPDELITTRAEAMSSQHRLSMMTETEVLAIDAASHRIETSRGAVEYSRLVLALGADPIRLPIEGDGAGRVLSINDLSDYARFRNQLSGARRIAILGAGLIGCEFSDDLNGAGYHVDVIDLAPQPLGRLLPPGAADHVRRGLADAGIGWHLGASVARADSLNAGVALTLADGERIEADLVLSAVGLRPRTALAKAAGLEVNRGVVTDRYLAASAADIYALGDCVEIDGLTLPFVLPLMIAARTLAKTLAGVPTPVAFPAMPVVVKTPTTPVLVSPPPATFGNWVEETTERGVAARFLSPDGTLLGFALTGDAIGLKQTLTPRLPPVLG